MSYPLAKGHMAEVWAKVICPICDDDLEHVCDEYETDEALGALHLDTYSCHHCDLLITYISPEKYHEYWQVPDSQHWYDIDS